MIGIDGLSTSLNPSVFVQNIYMTIAEYNKELSSSKSISPYLFSYPIYATV